MAIGDLNRKYIPEGHTLLFEGPQRYGKTLAMVFWAWHMWRKGRRIHSNIPLGIPHMPLEFNELVLNDGPSRFWGAHICIDELNFFFDGRESAKQKNIRFSTFLLQQKKQGCNLTGTTHDIASLDKRIRHNYDYVIRPTVFPAYPERPERLTLRVENGPLQGTVRKTLHIDCRPFLGLYDSFAVYDPFKKVTPK